MRSCKLNMVQYKLAYFDGRGNGEVARLILHHEGIKFEDIRLQWPGDWPGEHKSKSPFGKVPYLEADGKRLPESFAIDRYLARKAGLAGKDDWERAWVDAIADMVKDFMKEIEHFGAVAFGFEEGDKDKLLNDVFKPANEKLAANLEKILKESTSGFLVNSGYTWADFLVAENLLTNEEAVPGSLDAHPKLKEYKDRVYNIPKIKDYVANRKITTW